MMSRAGLFFVVVLGVAAAGCGGGGGGGYRPMTDGGDCDMDPSACGRCSADWDCGKPTPRCEKEKGRCVACLPTNDNCGFGSRCVAKGDDWVCSATCKGDADCQKGDGGAGSRVCCNGACSDTQGD